jgi:insulysin
MCGSNETDHYADLCRLFMGNESYPSENEYSQYLSSHGGSSNAFTAAGTYFIHSPQTLSQILFLQDKFPNHSFATFIDHTNYYFDVSADHLEGALDRFTQFFVSPLFNPSCVEREMQAVDSEHKKNIQSDNWRNYQLDKDLMDPNHPYCSFGTGNLETLTIPIAEGNTLENGKNEGGGGIRDVLLKFYHKNYSANIMKLVVLGKESLDTLESWVVKKTSGIKNLNIPVPSFNDHPLTKEHLQVRRMSSFCSFSLVY